MNTYNRFPVAIKQGKGSYVWDTAGKSFLDFTSGIATCNLGHVPEVVKYAVADQLEKLWHCSNLYQIEAQEQLATLLTNNSNFDQVFFCNSGAEANEAALKLVRAYHTERRTIVTFNKSFHGRTLATLSATGQEKVQTGFAPLLSGFTYLPYNDNTSLKSLQHDPPAAVMFELVQGEGGVIPADQDWIDELVQICSDQQILLVVDEVQTGMGRTGTLFAYEQYDFEPDIVTLAKGLGSGFPIGAMLAKEEVANAFQPGSHGSTFGGNPLAATAGLATVTELVHSPVIKSSLEKSLLLITQLKQLMDEFPQLKGIRGKGLLIGIEVDGMAGEIVRKAIKENLLILTAGPDVVRLLPPLTVTEDDILLFIEEFRTVLETLFS
ncbi:acetylornithine transaminase [Lentibacillus sp. Marseille-P4043]|uniref:acetylornithine transaminase n=1 Tax=Lentibacillus sp. Marseille-P4043 TaxID=2040293 RepID=UPI000D0B4284|nr:acetylornithine transaminase [Lentibacillus sp. Marseille-P4043]